MKIHMQKKHFKEDDRITITYANGESLGYSVTLHAGKRMILKGGERTYNCEYNGRMWRDDEPRFVLEERQRILEIESANGKIIYRRNKMSKFEELEEKAKQGHASSQRNLAFCFEHGFVVKKNLKKAAEWYKKAAAQGCGDAKYKNNEHSACSKMNLPDKEIMEIIDGSGLPLIRTLVKCPDTSSTALSRIVKVLVSALHTNSEACDASKWKQGVYGILINITKHKKLNSDSIHAILLNMSLTDAYKNIALHKNISEKSIHYILFEANSPESRRCLLRNPVIPHSILSEYVDRSHEITIGEQAKHIMKNPTIDGAMIRSLYLKVKDLDSWRVGDVINSIASNSLTPLSVIEEIFYTFECELSLLKNEDLPLYMRRAIKNTGSLKDAKEYIIALGKENDQT